MNEKQLKLFPWLIVFLEILIYLSMDAYVPALPEMSQLFHVSANVAQLTFVIWILGGVVVQLFVGPITDRFGRKPLLICSGLLYIVTSFICAFAPTIHVLLVARFFQGVSLPLMYTPGYAAINESFDTQKSIKIFARMQMLTKLTPAFAPLLGGTFLMVANWRWIFIIVGALSIIAVLLLIFKMPETLSEENRSDRLHVPSILKQYKNVLGNVKFFTLGALTYVPTMGLIAWIVSGPFIVVHLFHFNTLAFGIMQGLIFGCFLLGAQVVNRFSSKERNQKLISLGLVFIIVASCAAAVIEGLFPMHLFWLVFLMMLISFGVGITAPILARLTLDTSEETMGIKVSVFSLMRMGYGFLGSLVVSIFYANSLFSLALIMAVFALIALAIRITSYVKWHKA